MVVKHKTTKPMHLIGRMCECPVEVAHWVVMVVVHLAVVLVVEVLVLRREVTKDCWSVAMKKLHLLEVGQKARVMKPEICNLSVVCAVVSVSDRIRGSVIHVCSVHKSIARSTRCQRCSCPYQGVVEVRLLYNGRTW